MPNLTTIGFDADDTLWHHEKYFVATKERFSELLADRAPRGETERLLHDTEIANVGLYGFGVKSFTLSMIEAALAATGGRLPASLIGEIMTLGRAMLTHPVDPFPGVQETLEALKPAHKLLVVTRGDLVDQERKLAASGLLPFFDEIEIVSDKTEAVYERIFSRHGNGPDRAMMVGNSMRADVLPALAAGAWAVHVPSEHVWSLDLADDPTGSARFRRLPRVAEVLPLVAAIG
ncbi:MAG: HAD family hydrolase [Devosia sp.]|uniref:HAD family hydrolase n=1 Tax=Devosia sp. TaxID=1871048 RepID=UPI001ACC400C|nr:HAD family hydrolase [Devosia sp.]MBN9310446.1 HAD family hydrolase [Devosia sp.]MBN9316707.1 HAD family hydrolase [Devosia sp.]